VLFRSDTSKKADIGDNDDFFLVNLDEDITEMKNLAADHPGKVARLKKLHEQWLTEVSSGQ
jgi:hypothetical protein